MAKKKSASARVGRKGSAKDGKKCLGNQCHLLTLLGKADGAELSTALKCINRSGREAVYQCIYNCVYNPDIPKLKRAQIRKELGGKASILKYLANPGRSEKAKRKVLQQKGGNLLPLILSAAIPLITSLFGGGK